MNPAPSSSAAAPVVPLIAAEEVCFAAGGKTILDRVSLSVRPGEIVSLIGPNGAGKTTLLRILLGLLTPTAGSVRRREGLRIGYMPQRIAVDEVMPLTAARFLGLAGAFSRAQVRSALDVTGVAHLADRPIQVVSGGEMQRVLLARALLREPDLLVLDEPAQGVDAPGQGEMYELIARLRDAHGHGVLLVSHDLHLVTAAADSVVCLNQHVCCTGRPETVSRDAEYLRLFGPHEARGLAVYTHHHDHAHDLHGDVVTDGKGDGHG